MGHSVSDAAAASVKKSEKKEAKKNRTDQEIFHDIDGLLTAGLSVPPLDTRLLLTRYNELLDKVVGEAAVKLGENINAVEFHAAEVPATLPPHSGATLRVIIPEGEPS